MSTFNKHISSLKVRSTHSEYSILNNVDSLYDSTQERFDEITADKKSNEHI